MRTQRQREGVKTRRDSRQWRTWRENYWTVDIRGLNINDEHGNALILSFRVEETGEI